MKVEVLAKSNRGVFIGLDDVEGEYCVFSLDDTIDIDLEDVLTGQFDDYDGLFKPVYNNTQNESVDICVESWGMNKNMAIEMINTLSSPTKVWVVKYF